jgi:hypothetical protein
MCSAKASSYKFIKKQHPQNMMTDCDEEQELSEPVVALLHA